ncbi:hypothetical protein KKG36_00780 [Patescibacteria group bacterium]|nr:hypothetical protein [Patescibacteria group bacterium]
MKNFEALGQEENPDISTEDALRNLEPGVTSLEQEDKNIGERERTCDKKKLSAVRAAVASLIVAAGSFLAIGCDKKEGTRSAEGQKQVQVEKIERTKGLLREMFSRVSGGAISKMDNGNLVIHNGGGNYYELESSDLQALMEMAREAEEGIEITQSSQRDPKIKNQLLAARKNALSMQIKQRVAKIGEKVSFDGLPQNLKEAETARQRALEEMK